MLDTAQFSKGQTVVFGAGRRGDVKELLKAAGHKRALVLTTPQQSDLGLEIAEALGPTAAGIFTKATMHTPVTVTDDGLQGTTHSVGRGFLSVWPATREN